jgi:hypothetical protein
MPARSRAPAIVVVAIGAIVVTVVVAVAAVMATLGRNGSPAGGDDGAARIGSSGAPAGAPTRPANHHAYVWQRAWNDDVRAAVRTAPPSIRTLRVLAHELPRAAAATGAKSRRPPRVDVAVDIDALRASGRAVIPVLRIDGARVVDEDGTTDDADLAVRALVATARRWRTAGVDVVGVELDHDSATAALPDYARWLAAHRPPDERVAVTALPTWADDDVEGESRSAGLRALLAVVDDVVLQVHAIRTPTLFDPTTARADVERFATVAARPLFVAVPTYRVTLADAVADGVLRAEPAVVAPFAAAVAARADVAGLVWFRLGHPGDHDAWSDPTLRTVLAFVDDAHAGQHPAAAPDVLEPRVVVALRAIASEPGDALKPPRLPERGDGTNDVTDGGDIVVTNVGNVDADAPARIDVDGAVALLGVRGYAVHAAGRALVHDRPPRLRPGATLVVGTARGAGVSLVAR